MKHSLKILLCTIWMLGIMSTAYAQNNIPVYHSLQEYIDQTSHPENIAYIKALPVLMYHHISDDDNYFTISQSMFESHLIAMQQAGYTTVSIQDILNYVKDGVKLPAKPVLITFDDGYYSNYELAYPLLKQYDMKATIFVIGSSVGHKDFYKDTEYPIIPHFSYEEALEMEESGLVSIESHSYDMHQNADYEVGNWIRPTVSKLIYESKDHFKNAVKNDFELLQNDFLKNLNKKITAFSYPQGVYSDLSNETLEEIGVEVSFITETGTNYIEIGNPDSLKCLKRYDICNYTPADLLLSYLENE